MAVKQLSDAGPDGVLMGQSTTDKIGFYGLGTAIVQPSITAVSTTTSTTAINETRLDRLTAALVALNLVNTAG